MRDPFDPTDAERRQWAFDPDASAPVPQDWDIIITTHQLAPLFLELAEDLDCPNGDFFLHCLYLLVGDTVRTSGGAHDMEAVKQVIDLASESEVPEIRLWADRSRQLIRHGSIFDYHAWYGSGEIKPPR